MKKLSIEEKAKAYDEAIEKAKIWQEHLYDVNDKDYADELNYIFPELREELEDDRIRKELLNYLYDVHDDDEERVNWIAWLEKQDEQKPIDKVELKFKVGDYVVGKYISGYISEVRDDCYLLDYQGFPIDKQDNYHLWTIQDAKDGDVLAASDGSIFLFAGVVDCACKYYVALTIENVVKFNEGLEHYWETSRAVYPATKEQRDLLFQKMKEEGYEWDAEKKELKKIEQKPAWSEEDEETMSGLLSFLLINTSDQWTNYGNWLKSLKERYTWKPSDEQMEALDEAVHGKISESNALWYLYNDLKKLTE